MASATTVESGGCTTAGCTNPVTKPLACPKCMQYGVRNVFCGQACFKANYAQHKQIHALLAQMAGGAGAGAHRKTPPDGIVCPVAAPREEKEALPAWARGYAFTGPLRPAKLSPRRPISNPRVRKTDYAAHPAGVSESERRDRATNNTIRVYGPDELEVGGMQKLDDASCMQNSQE